MSLYCITLGIDIVPIKHKSEREYNEITNKKKKKRIVKTLGQISWLYGMGCSYYDGLELRLYFDINWKGEFYVVNQPRQSALRHSASLELKIYHAI